MRTLLSISLLLGLASPASQSATPVKDLTALLASHNQSAIAVKDSETGVFVAALYYPGVQLLVVSGRPPSTAAVDALLAAKQFQDVYASLQDAAAKSGRLFVQDMNADGLVDGGDSIDVVYDEGKQMLIDGNPKAHKLSEKAYREAVASADERYARAVTLLLEGARRAQN